MKTQLVIMAAGIGSRFGKGIKQLEKLGPCNEIIMDYSIHDAILAGFDEIIFIIRKEIEDVFKEIIGSRIEKKIKCKYVYQELNKLPVGFVCPKDRKKPYGTAHAILCAKDVIDSPFAVINADDFYGKESFIKLHDYLVDEKNNINKNMCMIGFIISNTLSDFGTVTRGVCKNDNDNNLITINETYDIAKENNVIKGFDENKNSIIIDENSLVSMNMWGMSEKFLDTLENRFIDFLKKNNENIKSEFLLPNVIDNMLKEKIFNVKVLKVKEKWFGITYSEDVPIVKKHLLDLENKNVYKHNFSV